MIENLPRFPGAIWLTLLLGLGLNNLPLPPEWAYWRPDFLVLSLIHWALAMRQNVNLFMAFFMGLLADTISYSLLGQHALGYVLVTYFAVRLSLRMSAEAFLQQFALIFIVVGIFMLINLWIRGVTGNIGAGLLYWMPLLSSLLVWPIYHGILGYFYVPRKMV